MLDRFILLDKEGYLNSWSITTGKILPKTKISLPFDVSKYKVFSEGNDKTYFREWYAPNLLL
jgi:hypothetical protein